MTSHFQDGGRDVILRRKVLPSAQCTRSVRPPPAAFSRCICSCIRQLPAGNILFCVQFLIHSTFVKLCSIFLFYLKLNCYAFPFLFVALLLLSYSFPTESFYVCLSHVFSLQKLLYSLESAFDCFFKICIVYCHTTCTTDPRQIEVMEFGRIRRIFTARQHSLLCRALY